MATPDNISKLYQAVSASFDDFKSEDEFRTFVNTADAQKMQKLYDAFSAKYDDFTSVDQLKTYVGWRDPAADFDPNAGALEAEVAADLGAASAKGIVAAVGALAAKPQGAVADKRTGNLGADAASTVAAAGTQQAAGMPPGSTDATAAAAGEGGGSSPSLAEAKRNARAVVSGAIGPKGPQAGLLTTAEDRTRAQVQGLLSGRSKLSPMQAAATEARGNIKAIDDVMALGVPPKERERLEKDRAEYQRQADRAEQSLADLEKIRSRETETETAPFEAMPHERRRRILNDKSIRKGIKDLLHDVAHGYGASEVERRARDVDGGVAVVPRLLNGRGLGYEEIEKLPEEERRQYENDYRAYDGYGALRREHPELYILVDGKAVYVGCYVDEGYSREMLQRAADRDAAVAAAIKRNDPFVYVMDDEEKEVRSRVQAQVRGDVGPGRYDLRDMDLLTANVGGAAASIAHDMLQGDMRAYDKLLDESLEKTFEWAHKQQQKSQSEAAAMYKHAGGAANGVATSYAGTTAMADNAASIKVLVEEAINYDPERLAKYMQDLIPKEVWEAMATLELVEEQRRNPLMENVDLDAVASRGANRLAEKVYQIVVEKEELDAKKNAEAHPWLTALGYSMSKTMLYTSLIMAYAKSRGGGLDAQFAQGERMASEHWGWGTAGTVAGYATDVTTIPLGMVGGSAGKATVGAVGKAMLKGRVGSQVAGRWLGSRLGGKVLQHGVSGGVNLAALNALHNPSEQLISTGEFNAGEWLGSVGEGFLLGAGAGVAGEFVGAGTKAVAKRVSSTAGKAAVKAAGWTTGLGAEAAVFAAPEWIEGADLVDGFVHSLGTLAIFKTQGFVTGAGHELSRMGRGYLSDVRDRIRSSQDSYALTDVEKRELIRAGYRNVVDALQEMAADRDLGEETLRMLRGMGDEAPSLMENPRIPEQTKNKLLYYLEGKQVKTSVPTGVEVEDFSRSGKTFWSVRAVGVNARGERVLAKVEEYGSREKAERAADEVRMAAERANLEGLRLRRDAQGGPDTAYSMQEMARVKGWKEGLRAVADEMGTTEEALAEALEAEALAAKPQRAVAGKPGEVIAGGGTPGVLTEAMDEAVKRLTPQVRTSADVIAEVEEAHGMKLAEVEKKRPSERTEQERAFMDDVVERLWRPDWEVSAPRPPEGGDAPAPKARGAVADKQAGDALAPEALVERGRRLPLAQHYQMSVLLDKVGTELSSKTGVDSGELERRASTMDRDAFATFCRQRRHNGGAEQETTRKQPLELAQAYWDGQHVKEGMRRGVEDRVTLARETERRRQGRTLYCIAGEGSSIPTGMRRPCDYTNAGGGKSSGFVVAGDVEKDKVLFVRDAQTGEVSAVPNDRNLLLGEAYDATAEIELAVNAAAEAERQRLADVRSGRGRDWHSGSEAYALVREADGALKIVEVTLGEESAEGFAAQDSEGNIYRLTRADLDDIQCAMDDYFAAHNVSENAPDGIPVKGLKVHDAVVTQPTEGGEGPQPREGGAGAQNPKNPKDGDKTSVDFEQEGEILYIDENGDEVQGRLTGYRDPETGKVEYYKAGERKMRYATDEELRGMVKEFKPDAPAPEAQGAVDDLSPQGEALGADATGTVADSRPEEGGLKPGAADAAVGAGMPPRSTGGEEAPGVDNQGNPIDGTGKLIIEKVGTIDEITDDDFNAPTRTVQLPELPDKVSDAIGAGGRTVIIKKNIFEKNAKAHKDLSPQGGRSILSTALYTPDLYGQNQKATRPYNWILIHLNTDGTRHGAVVLEMNHNKDNIEIVNWRYLEDATLKQKESQAQREGGLILTLNNAAGNTSLDLTSKSKGSGFVSDKQISGEESLGATGASEPMPVGKDGEPLFMQVTPERGHAYIFGESGLDRAEGKQFVKNNIDAAKTNLDKLKEEEPEIGTSIAKYNKQMAEWQQKLAEAQQALDYWNTVSEQQRRVEAEESAERERIQAEQTEAAIAGYEAEKAAASLAESGEDADAAGGSVKLSAKDEARIAAAEAEAAELSKQMSAPLSDDQIEKYDQRMQAMDGGKLAAERDRLARELAGRGLSKGKRANLERQLEMVEDELRFREANSHLFNMEEPIDVYEIVLQQFQGARGARFTYLSLQEELGYGPEEMRRRVGIIASKAKNGITPWRLAENIMAEYGDYNTDTLQGLDVTQVHNIVLDVIHSSKHGLRGAFKRHRGEAIDAARAAWREETRAAIEQEIYEKYGMSVEEYRVYDEVRTAELEDLAQNYDENEYMGLVADDMAAHPEKYRIENDNGRNEEHEPAAEGPGDGTGSDILPGTRVDDATGAGIGGDRKPGGKATDGAEGAGAPGTVPEESPVAEQAGVKPQTPTGYGKGSGQDNDAGWQRPDGGRVAGDTASTVEGDRNRSNIRVLESGLETSRNEHSDESERDRREAESERLVTTAKDNGLYFDRSGIETLGEKRDKKSGESEVYLNRETGIVYKVKDPYAKAPMKAGVEPEDALYEHEVHNALFPETAYTLEGVSEDMGDVRLVLSQKFVPSVGHPTREQIVEDLARRGLRPIDKYTFGNEYVEVTDVGGDNVLVGEDGKLYFIDPIIRFKKPVKEILDYYQAGKPGESAALPGAEHRVTTEGAVDEAEAPIVPLPGENLVDIAQRAAQAPQNAAQHEPTVQQTIDDAIAEVEDLVAQQREAGSVGGETANHSSPKLEGEGYSIAPKPYTNKQGKTLDTYLVSFDRDFSKEEMSALRAKAKAVKGWYDRESGGWMLRSAEDARAFAEDVMSKSEDEIADEAPLSIKEVAPRPGALAVKPQGAVTDKRTQAPGPLKGEEAPSAVAGTQAKPKKRNKWISDEDAAEYGNLMDDLRRELGGGDIVEEPGVDYGNKPQVKPMNDEVLRKGMIVTYMMMKGGLRRFSDYCEAMVEELGDAIRQHLKPLYAATQMMEEVIEAGWDEQMDDRKTVKAFDVYNFDKQGPVDIIETAQHVVDEQESEKAATEILSGMKDKRNEKRKEAKAQAAGEKPLAPLDGEDYLDMAERVSSQAGTPGEGGAGNGARQASTEGTEQPRSIVESGARQAFVEDIKGRLGQKMGIVQLRQAAERAGLGDVPDTTLQELTELALVQRAREIVAEAQSDREAYDRIVELYEKQPTISMRSSERVRLQQYSTPLPISFTMTRWLADINPGSGLESCAGNGLLTIGLEPGIMHVNDLDPVRRENLSTQGYGRVTDQDALLPFAPKAYDIVEGNPPFGKLAAAEFDGFKIAGLEQQILANQLLSMKDHGRGAFVIGGNMKFDKTGRISGAELPFFNYLYSHYNVADVIDVDGSLFARQGTSYPIRVILINGRKAAGAPESYAPLREQMQRPAVKTFDELYKRIQDDILRSEKLSDTDRNRDGGATGGRVSPEAPRLQLDGPGLDTGVIPGAGRRTEPVSGGSGDRARRPVVSEQQLSPEGGGLDRGRRGQAGGRAVVPSDGGTGAGAAAGGRADGAGGRGRGTGADAERLVGGAGERRVDARVEEQTRTEMDKRAAEKPARREAARQKQNDQEAGTTTSYVPQSNAPEIGSVIPANMAEPVARALERLGDVDELVREALGYGSHAELQEALSAEQIDSVALAIHQMEQGKGFIIGDMTGVGKGRQAAALVRWAVKNGHKPIFVTEKAGLFTDFYRDLTDVGSGGLRPFILNCDSEADIVEYVDGERKVKYRAPRDNKKIAKTLQSGQLPDDCDFMVMTYSQLSSDRTGVKKNFFRKVAAGNILIFDESHNAGGDGKGSMFLREVLAGADKPQGVTFLSATYAKRPDNMPIYALMTDLGGSDTTPEQLVESIQSGGVPLQEIMSRALAASGQLIRRERDMTGVKMDWELIGDEQTRAEHRRRYDTTIALFNRIIQFQQTHVAAAVQQMDAEMKKGGAGSRQRRGTEKGGVSNDPLFNKTFMASRQLMFALKAEEIGRRVVELIRSGQKPVVALDNTMESFADMYLPDGEEFGMPTIGMSFRSYLDACMKITITDAKGDKIPSAIPVTDLSVAGQMEYKAILDAINEASDGVFASPIDAIKRIVRAAGYDIREMTGRQNEVVQVGDGRYEKVPRKDKDKKESGNAFNNGGCDALILNKSASTGVSFHASAKFGDQRPRCMVIAQPQLDPNVEKQMHGRIDRTGQVHRGSYVYAMCDVPAEGRLMMMLKSKFRSLDANTKSTQKDDMDTGAITDFLNMYGDRIVYEYLLENPDFNAEIYDPLGLFNKDGELSDKENSDTNYKINGCASRVCGRVALLPCERQEAFYKEIGTRYEDLIERLNEAGENRLVITSEPLAAETQAQSVMIAGRAPGSGNEFAENSVIERCEVNIVRKPMKMSEIRREQARLTQGATDAGQYRDMLMDKVRAELEQEKEKLRTRMVAKAEEQIKKAETQLRDQTAEFNVKHPEKAIGDDVLQDLIEQKAAEIRNEYNKRYNEKLRNLNREYEDMLAGLRQLPFFDTALLPTPEGYGRHIPCYVIGMKGRSAKQLRVVCATLDGRRKVEVPLNKGYFALPRAPRTAQDGRLHKLPNVEGWDEALPNEARTTAYIVTGNLLQAYPQMMPGSRIINFTDREGNIRQGIILPIMGGSEQGERLMGSTLMNMAKKADRIVPDRLMLSSIGGDVSVGWNDRMDRYEVLVPKTKKHGGKYWLGESEASRRLLGLVRGGVFNERGGRFVAEIPKANVKAVAKLMGEEFHVQIAESKGEGVSEPGGDYVSAPRRRYKAGGPTLFDMVPERSNDELRITNDENANVHRGHSALGRLSAEEKAERSWEIEREHEMAMLDWEESGRSEETTAETLRALSDLWEQMSAMHGEKPEDLRQAARMGSIENDMGRLRRRLYELAKAETPGLEVYVPNDGYPVRYSQASRKPGLAEVLTGPAPVASERGKGDWCFVERVFRKEGNVGFTAGNGGRIESADDVAYMFRALETAQAESIYAILVKDGEGVVVHMGTGSRTATTCDLQALRGAYDRVRPDKVYLLHNHPSGTLRPSREDVALTDKACRLLGLHGDEAAERVRGLIIDTYENKYVEFGTDRRYDGKEYTVGDMPRRDAGEDVPVDVYNFNDAVFDYDHKPGVSLTSPDQVAAFVAGSRVGARPKLAFVVCDHAGKPVANVCLPQVALTEENAAEVAERILSAAANFGGSSAMLYGSSPTLEAEWPLRRVSQALAGLDVRLRDALRIGGRADEWRSAVERGLMEPEQEYGGAKGEIAFDEISNGSDVSFRILEDDPFEKPETKKVTTYKWFRAKDGELYPAMIDNPSGAGTPRGVAIGADTAQPLRNPDGSLTTNTRGRISVKPRKLEKLAWRPDQHGDDHIGGEQFLVKNPATGRKELLAEDMVLVECEMDMSKDYTLTALEYGTNERGVLNYSQAGVPYITYDGGYRYRTNVNPEVGTMTLSHAVKLKRILDDDDYRALCEDMGITPHARKGGDIDLSRYGLQRGEQDPYIPEGYNKDGVDVSEEVRNLPGYRRNPIDFDHPNTLEYFRVISRNAKGEVDEAEARRMLEHYRSEYEATDAKVFAEHGTNLHDDLFEINGRRQSGVNDESAEAKREAVKRMSEALHTPVTIVEDAKETSLWKEADAETRAEIERSKGWYDHRTGEVVVVMGRNHNVEDVEQSMFHEGVAHHGIDELLGGAEQADAFYDEVYDHLRSEERARVNEKMGANGWDAAKATKEYMGELSEKGFEDFDEADRRIWKKFKAKVLEWLDKMLAKAGVKLPKWVKLGDNELRYMLWRSKKNLEGQTEGDYVRKAEDIAKRADLKVGSEVSFRDPENTGDIWQDGSLGLEERITNAALRLSAAQRGDLTLRGEAMRAVCDNLQGLVHEMRNRSGKATSFKGADAKVERGVAETARTQRIYDRTTVKRVADLARVLMQTGYLRDMTSMEMQKMVSAMKDATGAEDIGSSVEKIMDIMIDNQVRSGKEQLGELLGIRGSKVDARGVEVQGELDADGARMMQAVRRGIKMSIDEIQEKIAEAADRMGDSSNVIADDAALEYAGMQIALDYVENIAGSKSEELALRANLKDAKEEKEAGRMSAEAYRQLSEATEDAIRKNKIERAEAYNAIVGRLSGSMRESIENARAWREAEKQRIQEIQHNANSDLEGMPSEMHRGKETWRDAATNLMAATALAPLATFEQMVRGIAGQKSADGEGYLYNRFVRGLNDARAKEISGYRGKQKALDEKAKEIFSLSGGAAEHSRLPHQGKVKNWGDVIRLERKLPKMRVTYFDKSANEYRDAELMQGNLLYIYMVDKMTDGRMKLRKMGITESDVDVIADFLDPRIKALGDWLQEEFLVETRNEYNETHKRMFGTSMAAIDNYFPLKILGDARGIKEDIDAQDTIDGATSTVTGAIKKRKVNALALDILGADALNVVLDHIAEMEHWNAYAELGRDMNVLLSYGKFRNRVKNMRTIYGTGDKLWKRFKDVSRIAFGTYHQEVDGLDEGFLKIARGVTASKVAYKLNTALKQILSLPAMIPDVSVGGLIEGLKNPRNPFTWCMENLPVFEERWRSRISGDPRLMKSERGWNDWRNNAVEIAGRWGMTPNAFVDAVICSIVAKTIYDTKLSHYLKDGYKQAQAEARAKQDASIGYNLSQQSSEGAYLAPMQAKKNWLSVMLTVFRNASMSYTRQVVDSVRNLSRVLRGTGKHAEGIEYMTKQTLRDWGIDPDQATDKERAKAERAAKRRYRRALRRDALRLLTYGFVLPGLWSLGGYWLYMLLGNDDEEKDPMKDDIYARLCTAPLEGLTGGDVLSNVAAATINDTWDVNTLAKDMPVTQDIADAAQKLFKDGKTAEGINDIFNLCAGSFFGVDPATIENAVLGIMDACGNDVELANEATIMAARILNYPESQVKKLYFDEIGMSGEEASKLTPAQIAERYARMQVKLGRPIMPWLWDDEGAIDKHEETAKERIKERLGRQGDKDVNAQYLEYQGIYEGVDAQMRAYNKAKETDYVKAAEIASAIQDDPESYRIYEGVKAADKQLNRLTKYYLRSETAEEAAMLYEAILTVKAYMVEAIKAEDEAARDAVGEKIDAYMDEVGRKYEAMHSNR